RNIYVYVAQTLLSVPASFSRLLPHRQECLCHKISSGVERSDKNDGNSSAATMNLKTKSRGEAPRPPSRVHQAQKNLGRSETQWRCGVQRQEVKTPICAASCMTQEQKNVWPRLRSGAERSDKNDGNGSAATARTKRPPGNRRPFLSRENSSNGGSKSH